jgi:hypothetical protein
MKKETIIGYTSKDANLSEIIKSDGKRNDPEFVFRETVWLNPAPKKPIDNLAPVKKIRITIEEIEGE